MASYFRTIVAKVRGLEGHCYGESSCGAGQLRAGQGRAGWGTRNSGGSILYGDVKVVGKRVFDSFEELTRLDSARHRLGLSLCSGVRG